MMLIVDAHEDIAWNMLTFGRDYNLSAAEIRLREKGSLAVQQNEDTLLGWPEYQRGRVGLIFATLFAAPIRRYEGKWDTLIYRDFDEAHRHYRSQVDVYRRLSDDNPSRFRLVMNLNDMTGVLEGWKKAGDGEPPLGLVILMEGAEGVRDPDELEEWWEAGVRLIGPAWAGTRFCGGTREPGPLTSDGYALLDGMAEHGFILDISHMDEQSVFQALDHYPRTVVATHANASALLKGMESNRHLSDAVIRRLVERGGVIGIVPINPFLKAGWKRGDRREEVTLENVVAQMDYICQLAGDARHVGLGTDYDGGFGLQSAPAGVDTIADLQKIIPLLEERGYTEEDLAAIFSENWISILKHSLP